VSGSPPPARLYWGSRLHASCIRLTVLAVWLSIIATTPYHLYESLADVSTPAHGVRDLLVINGRIREILLSHHGLILVQLATLTSLIGAMCCQRMRHLATPAAFLGVLVLDSVTKMIGGFANHARVVPLLLLGVFALFASRPFLTVSDVFGKRVKCHGTSPLHSGETTQSQFFGPTWVCGMIIVLPYTYIGIERLVSGGLQMFTGDVLLWYLSAASRSFESYPAWLHPINISPLLNIGFFITSVAEASSFVLLFAYRCRALWLGLMIVFQLFTLAYMNILFWENLLISWVVFSKVWWPEQSDRRVE
jgi:hypothetical protein